MLKHLYDNAIENAIVLVGDSHQNWLDSVDYDPATGAGAIGVEFAVTETTNNSLDGPIAENEDISAAFVRDNEELLWQEGYCRGYTELHISPEKIEAQYIGCPTVPNRNAFEISLANFTVDAGENHVVCPVANGGVEAGPIAEGQGEVRATNLTKDLETGEWLIHVFDVMFPEWALE